jgi:hypothetical protein
MPVSVPLYRPSTDVTGRATGAPVIGCRFVKSTGPKVNGGNIPVAHAAAADQSIGVVERDTPQNKTGRVFTDGFITTVCAAGPITAGLGIQGAADGKVATLSSGVKRGVALESATADGDLILAQIQF